jgi:hypothetical protein
MNTTCTRLISLALLTAAAGCLQHDPSFPSQEELYDLPPSPDELLVRFERHSVSVKVSDADLVGPDVRLSIYKEPHDSSVRGTLWGRPVNLAVARGSARGAVGTTLFHLATRREGDALHATGTVQHRPTDFTVSRDRFVGSVGSCTYELRRTEPLTYEGERSCEGPGTPLTMRIPDELSRWGDVGSATALALLLSES